MSYYVCLTVLLHAAAGRTTHKDVQIGPSNNYQEGVALSRTSFSRQMYKTILSSLSDINTDTVLNFDPKLRLIIILKVLIPLSCSHYHQRRTEAPDWLYASCSLTLSSQNPNKLSPVSLCCKGSLLWQHTHTVNILKVKFRTSCRSGS